jgi:hypothetical protein
MPASRFRVVPDVAPLPYPSLEVYDEVKAARPDQAGELCSRYHVRPRFAYTGCLSCGLLGVAKENGIELKLLARRPARDTVETRVGEIREDTIVGTCPAVAPRRRASRRSVAG